MTKLGLACLIVTIMQSSLIGAESDILGTWSRNHWGHRAGGGIELDVISFVKQGEQIQVTIHQKGKNRIRIPDSKIRRIESYERRLSYRLEKENDQYYFWTKDGEKQNLYFIQDEGKMYLSFEPKESVSMPYKELGYTKSSSTPKSADNK